MAFTPGSHPGLWMKIAPSTAQAGATFPAIPFLDIPPALKAQHMFGPEGSFLPAAQEASRRADAPLPTPELIDIVATWPREAAAVLAQVSVPIHYRQGEYDNLWTVSQSQIQHFASACTSALRVDARVSRNQATASTFITREQASSWSSSPLRFDVIRKWKSAGRRQADGHFVERQN